MSIKKIFSYDKALQLYESSHYLFQSLIILTESKVSVSFPSIYIVLLLYKDQYEYYILVYMCLCLYSTKIKHVICVFPPYRMLCFHLLLCCHHSCVQDQLCHSRYLLVLLFCVHFHSQIYIKGTPVTEGKTSWVAGCFKFVFIGNKSQVSHKRKILVFNQVDNHQELLLEPKEYCIMVEIISVD